MMRSRTGGSHPYHALPDRRQRSVRLADAKAVGFRAEDAALLREPTLLQTTLQNSQCGHASFHLATFRLRLLAAEEDMPSCDRHTDRGGDARSESAESSDTEVLRVPRQAELVGRRHVAEQRRRRHDGGAGQIAFAAEAHAVLPVAVE